MTIASAVWRLLRVALPFLHIGCGGGATSESTSPGDRNGEDITAPAFQPAPAISREGSKTNEGIKIGLFGSIEEVSPDCFYTTHAYLRQAAAAALSDHRRAHAEAGGSHDTKVSFVVYDYGNDPKNTEMIWTQANDDGIVAAIGYPCSTMAVRGAFYATRLGIPLISPTATADVLVHNNPYFWTMSYSDSLQGRELAEITREEMKRASEGEGAASLNNPPVLLISAVDSTYSVSLAEAFANSFGKNNIIQRMTLVGPTGFDDSALDKFFPNDVPTFGAMVLPLYAPQASVFIRQSLDNGFHGPFLLGDGWYWGEETKTLIGTIPEGTRIISIESWAGGAKLPEGRAETFRSFSADYQASTGMLPRDVDVHVYDATWMLLDVIDVLGESTSRGKIKEILTGTESQPFCFDAPLLGALYFQDEEGKSARSPLREAFILEVTGAGSHADRSEHIEPKEPRVFTPEGMPIECPAWDSGGR